MDLAALLKDDAPAALAPIPVTGLTADSRAVRAGSVFFALKGEKTDGMAYAEAAVRAGAAAVVTDSMDGPSDIAGVPVARVANARRALALAASRFYPRQPATIAAVTGTSGKTSVAAFLRQIFAAQGFAAASIGTVGVVRPSGEVYGGLTTPDPLTLHETLDTLAGEGVTHLAFEASSHGLDQFRLDGVRIAAAAFTNLSRDHLDYHLTVEAYRAAKLRLFAELLPADGTAVVMTSPDGQFFSEAARRRGQRLIEIGRTGQDQTGGIVIRREIIDGAGQIVEAAGFGESFITRIPLLGSFQVDNALVAAALAIGCGVAPKAAFAALEHLEGAKGRLDFVGAKDGAPVVVDYAHKPDALDKVLEASRPFAAGRLVVVFGCGGDRDAGKRPIMGRIAVERADRVIVTDDNPRSENPAAIRAAILAAAPGAEEIGDRTEAIRTAVRDLKSGDLLVIAGKGHESGQIVGSITLPFSDHEVAAKAIRDFQTKAASKGSAA
ncbi:UDP-N-acetylmuramoyl-L-alanyl-D-glutamate--2,6-diaminopimelate ligase [Phreatobacter stygius]|uniref:UDP-N-acetylmuramoyl-L-alanyl-D-glutamate--2,6-diaminopimelate ligase n=1 Tax=Phreatobacter stygius TaxID=1940610 RepID=A0A4D7B890_9HYPH|nr:UDP-N-acetylmuramoyl-L-alanyl-D-glutamate--2,6-diaminopimelate ligase [Phreatobacter stygius]QCI65816.1 UDP-N-acetylmuramoyl-L-alanyl-D-glutamate--2,6-diaminopimelate ligase [Phreatobacter stygius]